ncbi:putative DUF4124 domain-containing protein [Gammaproteobacteria bacterium]
MKKIQIGLWLWGGILLGLHPGMVEAANNFFKWTDEKGVIHYGDHVPPEDSQKGRAEVNKYGLTVGVTSAAKTKEQLIEDERKARIQAEERRKVEEQMAKDRVLLTSYANEKDLEMGRNGKLDALDGIIRITESNIAILRRSMSDMTAQAAERERSGQSVPDDIRRDISSAQDLVTKHDAYIKVKRKEQEELRAQFDADLKRFRELRAMQGIEMPESTPLSQDASVPKMNNIAQETTTKALEAVSAKCDDSPSCAKAWSLAQLYVRAKANTRLQVVTNTRLLTTEPTQSTTIGLSVIRTQDQGGARLVLDVLCHNSPEGQKYCHTPQVRAVLDGFKDYVEGH